MTDKQKKTLHPCYATLQIIQSAKLHFLWGQQMYCTFKARTPPPTTIQYRLTDWCQLHWDEFKWVNSFQHNILKFPYRCLFNKLNLFHFRKDNSLKKFKIQGFRANTVPISQKLKISQNRISLFLWGPGRVYITQKGSKISWHYPF